MTADEMFKELGYIEHYIHKDYEEYRTDSSHSAGRSIIFNDNKKIIMSHIITIQELKAINKKCEEFGWNE